MTTIEEFAASAAFRHAPAAYSLIRLDGTQVAANPAFMQLFRTDTLIEVEAITHDTDRERTAAYLESLRSGQRDRIVLDKRYVRGDGTEFWGRLTATAMPGPDGRPAYLLGIIEDVTDHMTSLDRMREASEAKSRFVARVSHDLRTPLHAIGGLAELLGEADLGPAHREFAEAIRAEADALRSLVDDLLDLTRLEEGRIELRHEDFGIGDCVRDVVALVGHRARTRDVSIEVDIAPTADRAASGDRNRLRQVLLNLVDNAVKFTTDRVLVRVSATDDPEGAVRFEVEDSGPGIAPDDVDRIFEPFAQAHADRSGTGLGLNIARDLVEMMGGSMGIRSEPGKGAVFTVTLPLDLSWPVAPHPAQERSDRPTRTTPRVLVVEDSPINQLLATAQLDHLGCRAEIAESGEVALRLLTAEVFDLVLMDWHLPDMDGLETTRRWRAHEVATDAGRVPIVAVTARAMTGDRERCLDAGMDDFLSKPTSLDDLRGVLDALVGAGAAPTTGSAPVADATTAALDRLLEDLGDPALVHTLVSTFLTELPSRRQTLETAMAAGDLDLVRRTAHTLKSTSAVVGATELAQRAADLEAQARAGGDVASLRAGLNDAADHTLGTLVAALDRLDRS